MGRPKGFNREEVLEKTAKLFLRKGFADTSLIDIEKTTGVNKSGLYSEFSSKDDVFLASLSHFISTSGIIDLLTREPLGWKNIEDLLLNRYSCDGQKSCFVVNSIRESQIIPLKAKSLIAEHVVRLKTALEENLKSEGLGGKAELISNIILTFNSGLCLEANMKNSNESSKKNVEALIQMLKTTFRKK